MGIKFRWGRVTSNVAGRFKRMITVSYAKLPGTIIF